MVILFLVFIVVLSIGTGRYHGRARIRCKSLVNFKLIHVSYLLAVIVNVEVLFENCIYVGKPFKGS